MAQLIPECLTDMNRLSEIASLSSSFSSEDTDLFIMLVNAASKFILNRCRRDSFKYKTVSNEDHNGESASCILTRYRPIISVTSLYDDSGRDFESDTLIDTDDYRVENAGAGLIRLLYNTFGNYLGNVRVSYVSGYSDFVVYSYPLVFNEGASDLTATITSGKYNASSLATEIKTQLDATGSDTYTVTYSETTHKYTVASDGTSLALNWTDSTDLAYLLGYVYTADDTGALTYTADYPALGIPEDIIEACNTLVRWRHSETKQNRIGTFADNRLGYDFATIPPIIFDLIKPYERRAM